MRIGDVSQPRTRIRAVEKEGLRRKRMTQKTAIRLAFAAACVTWPWMLALGQEAKPERLRWHDSYAAAKKEAEASGKPLFLEFRCAP
jgi:hypothetical protein